MIECKLDNTGALAARLAEIEAKVAKKHTRRALRDGAKVVQRQLIASAPVATGRTKAAAKVRSAKKSRRGITMVVSIGKSMYSGATFYAGFVNYGWRWIAHRARVGGRFIKAAADYAYKPGGRVEMNKGTAHQIEGTRWMQKAFEVSKEAAAKVIEDRLREGLEAEAKAGGKQ